MQKYKNLQCMYLHLVSFNVHTLLKLLHKTHNTGRKKCLLKSKSQCLVELRQFLNKNDQLKQ